MTGQRDEIRSASNDRMSISGVTNHWQPHGVIEMGLGRLWGARLVILVVTLLSVSGCSSLHGGLSVGQYFPVQSDFAGGAMYGIDLNVKVNDKWRAGVALHQLKDYGDSEYAFIKTYTGPFGGSSPATSTITMISKLVGVQYYLKDNLIVDASVGQTDAQISEEGSWYSYGALPGDKVPEGNLYKMSLLYTTKEGLSGLYPYVGISYLYLDVNGALQKADGSRLEFSRTNAIGLAVGIKM